MVDVRSRLGESELIVAEDVGRDRRDDRPIRTPLARRSSAGHCWASMRTLGVRAEARAVALAQALAGEYVRRARARRVKVNWLAHGAADGRGRARVERLGFAAPPSSTSRSARCSPPVAAARRELAGAGGGARP